MFHGAEKLVLRSDAVAMYENERNNESIPDDVAVLAEESKLVWFLVGVTVVKFLVTFSVGCLITSQCI